MPSMTGKEALARMLIAEGLDYVFGNPGTSESPLLDVLQDFPQLNYVQALQEGTAVGMADGYARATGRPSFANIHIAGGLANGISALYNAYRGGTPLILTAGNSDTRMYMADPTLSGDLVAMTAQYTKWSAEVIHASDIPIAVRRAFKEAKTPPTGPVFLSFPWDSMDDIADVDISPSSPGYFRTRPDRDAVARASQLLSQAENPVIVVGDRVAQSGAVPQMTRLAEQLGAKVYASAFAEVNFPTSHPLWGGLLNLNNPSTSELFTGADVVLAVGANIFNSFLYIDRPFLGPSTKLVHLDSNAAQVERIYSTEVGILADPGAGLEELSDALGQDMSASAKEAATTRTAAFAEERRQADEAYRRQLVASRDQQPMAVDRMMHELAQAVPPDTIVADESITSRPSVMRAFNFDQPGSLHVIRGGALGWAMPGALGVQLANPDRPVLAIVGDGSSLYTVQALWTAARYNIPVVYAICNNRSYQILKVNMDIYLRRILDDQERKSEFVGMDFANPLDLAGIAQAMGVAGKTVKDPDELGPAVRQAFDSGKPTVLDVSIAAAL